MGRKKPSRKEEERPAAAQGRGKSKKKSLMIGDDEYLIRTDLGNQEEEVEALEAAAAMPIRGKKGGGSKAVE
ncbi:hypothetical protein Sjap_021510 [Stephania japonica]|uniref:Uncharacterized protein n=1 Tax=Stephania japonica TaxID=461633 RepID=A0AAP0HP31_9MAGN